MPSTRLALTPEQRAELWFSKIERDVIARGGVFTSVTDLRRKLMRYIKQYNKTAKPFRWALRRSDEAHRMIAVQVVRTVH
jgi:hypothetical protein